MVYFAIFLNAISLVSLVNGSDEPDYASMVSRVENLELKILQSLDLESRLVDAKEYIQLLESKVIRQEELIQKMTSVSRHQSQWFDELDARLDALESMAKVKDRDNAFPDTDVKVKGLEQGHSVHANRISQISRPERQGSRSVAFTAYVDHNLDHLGIDQVVPFNKVLTNDGDGFDVQTGVFVSPEPGLYLFTFFISKYSGTEIVTKLVVDGVNQVDAIADPQHIGHDAMGGNTAVLHLDQGQHVWVATYFQPDVSLRSDSGYRFASFTGVKVSL